MKRVFTLVALIALLGTCPVWANYKSAKKKFVRALKTKNVDSIAAAAKELAECNNQKAVKFLLTIGLKADYLGLPDDKVIKVFDSVLEGLKGVNDPKAMKYIIKQASKRSRSRWQMNVMLIEVLKNNSSNEAKEAVATCLKHPRQEVQLAAIAAAKATKNVKAVPALINLVDKTKRTKNLTWIEARRALLAITGQDLDTPSDYRKWWSTVKNSFKPNSVSGGNTVIRKRKRVPKFFGTEVKSKRFVLVLDVSGSMMQKDPENGESGTGGGGSTARNPKKKAAGQAGIPEHRRRIKRAKNEMIKLIKSLDRDVKFNIVTFSNVIRTWKEKHLLVANAGNKAAAIKFVQGMKASGMTWTDHAVKKAFTFQEANTFYIASDGSPTHDGKTMLPTRPILDMIKAKNKFRRVQIYTLGFQGANHQFMRAMADENNGKYVDIR